MKFNPEQLLSELTELMAEADAESAKGGRLHKAGDRAHTSTKAEHHERMAELCAKMADSHGSMSDHYKTGGKNLKADPKKGDEGDEDAGEGDVEETRGKTAKSSGYGALDAVRNRPSRAREGVTRTELNETLNEFAENLMTSMVKVFTPPVEREQSSDELAAVRLLQSSGYVVRTPDGSGVQKGAALDTAAAPDKSKVSAATEEATAEKVDQDIELLKAKIGSLEANAMSNPSALAELAEARAKLTTLAKAAVRAALRNPHVASSGEAAGYRGVRVANQ